MGVAEIGEGFLLVGDTFLRSFYSSYDMGEGVVRLAVSRGGGAGVEIVEVGVGPVPEPEVVGGDFWPSWLVLLVAVACSSALLITICFLIHCTYKLK